jgi:CheY-like chemotaxis protein
MSEANDIQDDTVVPEEYVEQVKQVLERLYDFPYLQRHPLAQDGDLDEDSSNEAPAQRLRREILTIIEEISPGPGVGFRAPHARVYGLLHLRFVEGMTVQEAAHDLGISTRQAYRDLRRGEESVAAVLWSRRSSPQSSTPGARQLSSLQAEMDGLESHPHAIDLCSVLHYVEQAVVQLARQRSVSVDVRMPADPVIVYTEPAFAQQALISIISRAIQQMNAGDLDIELAADQDRAAITLRYTPTPDVADAPVIGHAVAHVIEQLEWVVEQEVGATGQRVFTIQIATHGPTVLVIDDNAGLVDLLRRYLSNHACHVVATTTGEQGLQMSQEVLPDAIVLDVMMPQIDGWEVLQTLRNRPQTKDIPVIICSVFNDPELAYSLGASLVVPKPVRRDDILAALRELGVV